MCLRMRRKQSKSPENIIAMSDSKQGKQRLGNPLTFNRRTLIPESMCICTDIQRTDTSKKEPEERKLTPDNAANDTRTSRRDNSSEAS